jgi:hypothetical protein
MDFSKWTIHEELLDLVNEGLQIRKELSQVQKMVAEGVDCKETLEAEAIYNGYELEEINTRNSDTREVGENYIARTSEVVQEARRNLRLLRRREAELEAEVWANEQKVKYFLALSRNGGGYDVA